MDRVDQLINDLKNEDVEVRRKAASALKLRDPRVLHPLIEALKDEKIGRTAARGLEALADPRAVEPLVAAMQDKDKGTKSFAITLAAIGPASIGPLVAAFPTLKDMAIREAAIALRRLGDPRGAEVMIAALINEAPLVYDDLITQLGRMGAAAVEPLLSALKSSNPRIRNGSIEALGKNGDVRGVEPLIGLLSEEDTATRQRAIWALGRIGDATAVEPLLEVFDNTDEPRELRGSTAIALGRIGDTRAIESLIAEIRYPPSIGSESRELKEADIPRVGTVRTRWAIARDQTIIEAPRVCAARALGYIGDAKVVELLIESLQDEEISDAAAYSLGEIGDLRAVEPLIAHLDSGNTRTYYATVIALGKVGDSRAVEPLIACLERDDSARGIIVEALGKIGDTRAVEPVIKILQHPEDYMRSLAVQNLGYLGDSRAIEPVTKAMEEPGAHIHIKFFGHNALNHIALGGKPQLRRRTPIKLTADEFLQRPQADPPEELLDGELLECPSPRRKQKYVAYMTRRLLKRLGPNGKVVILPLRLRLDEGNVPGPDVVWLSESSHCRIREQYVEGVPDLVVEVLSRGKMWRSKMIKFRLYERHGVREYWLADPDAQYLEVWKLDGGRFVQMGVYGPEDSFESSVLGKSVELKPVFPEDKPEAKS